MRLFVTGATGFVGSHFVQAAESRGHEVIALRRENSRIPEILDGYEGWITGELDGEFASVLSSCHCLVHLAASGVNPSEVSWQSCYEVNLNRSLALWRNAVDAGVKHFVIAGSCFEYGRSGLRYDFIPTHAPLEPTDPYGASKAAASMAASALAESHGVSITVARLFHTYGEGEAPHRFWSALKNAAASGSDFPMTTGLQIRDFTRVEEAVRQLLDECEGIRDKDQGFRIRHIASGEPKTLLDFAKEQWSLFGAKGRLKPGEVPYRERELMRYVPEISSS